MDIISTTCGKLNKRQRSYLFSDFILDTWAAIGDEFMTSLMDNAYTDLALIALFTQSPDEIAAMRTKCRLP